jgi:hypothetical protein
MRQRARPLSLLHALGFERDVAPGRHDQGEGELGGCDRRVALAGRNRNPKLGAGGKVDQLRAAADQREELELRQSFEERAGKFDALADSVSRRGG